mmetsp:Transcript_36119/g.52922  ORF Transcript_36119/g.52922 Transcript_36119/m.52922 type:complete len:866 (-) Transcript_36119:573-3170(-)
MFLTFLSSPFSSQLSNAPPTSYATTNLPPQQKQDGQGGYTKIERRETVALLERGKSGIKTGLYPAWTTPMSEFRNFGIGVAVYFETMRALAVICLVAGLLYLPSIMYYDSTSYDETGRSSIGWQLRGSLMCHDTKWVPCPTCTLDDWADSPRRYAIAENNLVFVLANECADIRLREGLQHLVVILFLAIAIFALGFHQKKLELQYDEAILSASDYSIKVDDPPLDATDPDEWKEFFSRFEGAHVTYVTVGLDNKHVVNALIKRRLLLQKLRQLHRSEHGTKEHQNATLEDLIAIATKRKPRLARSFIKTEEKCRNLLSPEKTYGTTSIFVTFETESAQRNVLRALSVGHKDILQNNVLALNDPNHAFRGKYVLSVAEAPEPSTIRWQDQDATLMMKLNQRILTSLITIVIVWGGFISVRAAFRRNYDLAAFLIAIFNILVPQLFKLVNKLEAHPDEGSWQASLYMKVCTFRWINTAIVMTMVTPFMHTIAVNGLLAKLHAVLRAEIITQPVVHMLDILHNIKRHIFAPFSANQETMDSNFHGSIQHLGEKYTAMTKIIFLCIFYSPIFPASFFYGAFAYAANFYTDKFLFFRSWAAIPRIGNDVAVLSRNFYFPMTLVIMVIMSEFYMSAYPFDSLCDTYDFVNNGDEVLSQYIGTHRAYLASGGGNSEAVTVTVNGDVSDRVYRFCSQDFSSRVGSLLNFFDENKDDWMSEDQIFLTYLYGLCVVVAISLSFVFFFQHELWDNCKSFFTGTYHTEECDSGARFSDQEEIKAYVPQYHHLRFARPLLSCDIDAIDQDHIGWTDLQHTSDFYNLTKGIEHLTCGREKNNSAFAVVKHWAPKKTRRDSNFSLSFYGSTIAPMECKHF